MKIQSWNNLTILEKKMVLQRPVQKQTAAHQERVQKIINSVKQKGDVALVDFTQQFDNTLLTNLRVNPNEFEQAEKSISPENKTAIKFATEQIKRYQTALKPKTISIETINGVMCERQARAIENIGLYAPGGNTPLISTVMMLAIPAEIAGCKNRILCTPPKTDGSIDSNLLFTAKHCGIDTIYKIGGAQAIAAMAYGTHSIPKVDKIFGPGNFWVTEAKQQIAQDRDGAIIDMPAGPSEVLIIADDKADLTFVAADVLSQVEHGPDSQAIVIVLSKTTASTILSTLEQQLDNLPRKSIAKQSLANSVLIIVDTIETAVQISNHYAPEHLILQIENPEAVIDETTHAGAIFVGPWAPETLGDYVTGANHVLPTNGCARTVSGLSVLDFIKFISIQRVNKVGLENIASCAERLAGLENLQAHKNAVTLRWKKINDNMC